MFQVRATYPCNQEAVDQSDPHEQYEWSDRFSMYLQTNDDLLIKHARKRSSFSGMAVAQQGRREIAWEVDNFRLAVDTRIRLLDSGISGLRVTIREA